MIQTTAKAAEALRKRVKARTRPANGPANRAFHLRLLEYGAIFQGRTPSNQFPVAREFMRRKKPKMKKCFYNAAILLMDAPEAQYWEGYMFSPSYDVLVHHAWVLMPGRKVLDVTADVYEQNFQPQSGTELPDPADYLYFGIEVPRDFVVKSLAGGYAGPVLEQFLQSQGSVEGAAA